MKWQKYHNRKTVLNGETFDSVKEAQRYVELLVQEKEGKIRDLKRQVKFELLPSQKLNGKVVERPVNYIADFVYEENGRFIVEDTKGIKTKEYILKRKMMLFFKGIRIREI